MKTKHLLIALVLCAWLLTACGIKEAPALAGSEGTQEGDPTRLEDCEFQPESGSTKHDAECEAMTDLLDKQVEMQNILGMTMAVRLADGTVIRVASGYTSPSGNERWSANTPSLISSITKTFTAVVVMQLVEEGKLSLDDTVDTWFPEQPNGDKITVRMLLSHTSGLANFSTIFGNDEEKWTREWTPEELIALRGRP